MNRVIHVYTIDFTTLRSKLFTIYLILLVVQWGFIPSQLAVIQPGSPEAPRVPQFPKDCDWVAETAVGFGCHGSKPCTSPNLEVDQTLLPFFSPLFFQTHSNLPAVRGRDATVMSEFYRIPCNSQDDGWESSLKRAEFPFGM